MKFIPRSLTVRTVLVLAVAVTLSEFATFWVLHAYRHAVFVSHRAELVASYVQAMTAALDGMPSAERLTFSRSVAVRGGLRLVRAAAPADAGALPPTPYVRQLARGIRTVLGAGTAVELRDRPEPALWVSMPVANESWWMVLPMPPRHAARHTGWLIVVAVVVAIVVSLAWLYVWSIARPLHALAEATRGIGAGRRVYVEPRGPQELRALASRFNDMTAELEQRERERDVMLAGLPHDLRTPLARLRLRLALDDDIDTHNGIARDAAEIERITGQFLDYLRGNRGEDPVPVALGEFLDQIVAPYRELGRDVTVRTHSNPVVALCPAAMKRLVANLIDNALRHGAEPVEVAVSESDDGTVSLEVRDRGPGISEELRSKAFEPFSRLDPARTRSGSCGLGLAIVQRIAAMHGGSVELHNAPDGGLQVQVLLDAGQPLIGPES